MGADAWQYFVPYQENIQKALEELQHQEFVAGRFLGSNLNPISIEQAFTAIPGAGTSSILDAILGISQNRQSSAVAPLSEQELNKYFKTTKPTHDDVTGTEKYFDDLLRGEGIYIIIYQDEEPKEICFAGLSYD